MTREELRHLTWLLEDSHPDAGQRVQRTMTWAKGIVPEDILSEINAECGRQSELWGDLHDDKHSPYDWTRIITKFIVKANDAAEECEFVEWRGRMVQLAAIAVSGIRAFDRRRKERGEE